MLGYESLLDAHLESINVEVGQREPNMTETQLGASKTALLNPINGQALVDPYPVRCLSYLEAMVEKLRAALCRREVAIRDFFDVDYAVRNTGTEHPQPSASGPVAAEARGSGDRARGCFTGSNGTITAATGGATSTGAARKGVCPVRSGARHRHGV